MMAEMFVATVKPKYEVDDNLILDESADLIASGYEATCPGCQAIMKLIEVPKSDHLVYCNRCTMWFDTELPEHAYALIRTNRLERRSGDMSFYPPWMDQQGDPAEQAQQEADHQRDVERDMEMVTEDTGRPPGLGLPQYSALKYGIGGILNYSYWNCNSNATAIVAIEGGAADWAAYIGATESRGSTSMEETVRWVCRKGAKLSREQAHRWFPQLPIEAYRE